MPALTWLLDRPVMAAGQGILAVHGGPCERLVIAMQTLGWRRLSDLEAAFQEAREAGFDHPLTEEGASVLAPGRTQDDMFTRPVLRHRLLRLAGARHLAVGHSPFLHFPRGRWVDIEDPGVRRLLETPAFLGPHGEVLKLDTDMKRGGPAWLVSAGIGTGRWHALREDGYRITLDPQATTRHPAGRAAGTAKPVGHHPRHEEAWPLEGVDAETLQQVYGELEALAAGGAPHVADRVRARLPFLLHAGIADLAPIVHGLRWRGSRLEEWAAWFDTWADRVADRYRAWPAELEARCHSGVGDLVFLKPPRACRVDGYWVQMLPSVAREAAQRLDEGAAGAMPRSVVTVSYLRRKGEPCLRIHRFVRGGREVMATTVPAPAFDLPQAHVAAIVAQVRERSVARGRPLVPAGGQVLEVTSAPRPTPGKWVPGAPVVDPAVRRCLRAWVRAAAPASATVNGAGLVVVDAFGRVVPGRYLVDLGDAGPVPVVEVPGGFWLPVNTSFRDPARRYPVVVSQTNGPRVLDVDHATWLAHRLSGDRVTLYSAVSPQVAALIQRGDVEAMGLNGAGRPLWQRGRYLFLSPWKRIGDYFYNKPITVSFQLPARHLLGAVEAGLMTANLFVADHGEVLDPDARFGAPDIGLELVAVGTDGIAWLLDYRIR